LIFNLMVMVKEAGRNVNARRGWNCFFLFFTGRYLLEFLKLIHEL